MRRILLIDDDERLAAPLAVYLKRAEFELDAAARPSEGLAMLRRGHYDAHPNERVAIDQLRVARPWPWSPRLFRVQREVVQPRLERAVLADGSAAEMIREGAELARRI